MSLSDWLQLLESVPEIVVRQEEPMARHTLLRVGGQAEAWLVVESQEALEKTATLAKQHGVKTHFFEDSNVLVRDGGLSGVWIRMGDVASGVSIEDGLVNVGAQYPAAALARFCSTEFDAPVPFLEGRSGTVRQAFLGPCGALRGASRDQARRGVS